MHWASLCSWRPRRLCRGITVASVSCTARHWAWRRCCAFSVAGRGCGAGCRADDFEPCSAPPLGRCLMSRRQRSAREKAVRSRVAQAKVRRRRARGVGARRAATAATAAAVTLAGVGASAGEAAPTKETVEIAAGGAGASLLACGDPDTPPSRPIGLARVGGTLFFTADDGVHGRELWKSDGTRAGTAMVKDINPDTDGNYGPSSLTGVGGTLFFTADDGIHGSGVVEVGWHQCGHGPGQGHRPRRPTPLRSPSYLTRVGGSVVLHHRRRHPRVGVVEVGWHQGGHGPGQGHPSRRPRRLSPPR